MRRWTNRLRNIHQPSDQHDRQTSNSLVEGAIDLAENPLGIVFLGAAAFLLWRMKGPGKRKLQRDRKPG